MSATNIGSSLNLTGYDYEFVIPLDKKYECSICLLGLRTPVQTPCGHRFCHNCIVSSMNCCGEQCPFDNLPLNESQLFRDHFVEREILHFKVRCPNHKLGCSNQVDLQYVEDHIYACTYKLIMCPNECSAMVLQRELEEHMTQICPHRPVQCQYCSKPYSFVDEQRHLVTCSKIGIACDLCHLVVPRGDLPHHKSEVCPHAEISCTFAEHGCQHKAMREKLKRHMEDNFDLHLELLSSAYKRMKIMVSELVRSMPFSRQPSFRSQQSTTSIPEHSPIHSDRTLEGSLLGAVGESDSILVHADGHMNGKLDWDFVEEAKESQLSALSCDNSGKDSSSHEEIKKKPDLFSKTPPKNPEAILRDLSNKAIDINQRVMEEAIKGENISRRVTLLENQVNQSIKELSGRFCNGFYVWKIAHFSQLCDLMLKGKIVHSPAFYSSQFGYKFCLRTNISTFHKEDYLTLYIHMMQGEYDDILEWPFTGKITITLIDCSGSSPKHDLSEVMEVTTKMEAFLKPTSHKSIKGYGFKDFVLLDHIFKPNNGLYVKDDSLYIKAIVSPAPILGSSINKDFKKDFRE